MKQRGTVLVFKPGTPINVIKEALDKLAPILDEKYWTAGKPTVYDFDPRDGGPVWYLP